jgi:CheY-like chemotaxis protein
MPRRGEVFVIDDDDDTRNTVVAVLQDEGYTVRSSNNGRDALAVLAGSTAPDLVLLDLMMPVMSGWEVLQEMARTPHLASLPVVVFTAAGSSLAGDNTLTKPILRKPIDIDLLLDMVRSYCEAGHAGEEPPSDLLPRPSGGL